MRVLFDGLVPVAYRQMYVCSREIPDMAKAFAGQVNGLCGAAQPGELFLMTGTHSGSVRLTVERHDTEPPAAAAEWQEVVEVPFQPRRATVDLVPWGAAALAALPLVPDGQPLPAFRVRYCALGMDEGRNPFGTYDPDELADDDYTYMNDRPDRYLLALWPDERLRDVIVQETSKAAATWHRWAAKLM
ncbi:hypothetical protein [Paractinoplanes lichenicola]|uniref:Uncharacterized protein n=1 Tax=Paractinoplanes lichenicola TaxID=2802976 RepID=A0ABS1W2T6_9ACTN|nr:hypothetical protein [Actinoplanes lichenicola]MBL7261047.1 hypothetical protein [Actinoplanes lichenicola]